MPVNTSPPGQPNREVTSLGSFFGEIAERASTLTAKAGVRLTYTPPTREGMGNLDRDMAERAFYNLLSNALRFTPKGKTIQVTLTLDRERAVLRSRTKVRASIRRFSRISSAGTAGPPRWKTAGSAWGWGLLLVRQTAALHGGALLISEAPEGGTIAALSFRAESARPPRVPFPHGRPGLHRMPGPRPGRALPGASPGPIRSSSHSLTVPQMDPEHRALPLGRALRLFQASRQHWLQILAG